MKKLDSKLPWSGGNDVILRLYRGQKKGQKKILTFDFQYPILSAVTLRTVADGFISGSPV